MRLVDALKNKKSLKWGIFSAFIIGFILPVIQTGFFQRSFSSWILTLLKSPLNTSLYFIFILLTGVVISLFIYNKEEKSSCNVKKGSRFGAVGTFFGFFVGVCPACVGLIGLLFPLSVSITLTYYGWIFMTLAIILQLLSLKNLGGFKEQ